MRILSLNAWGGRLHEPLLAYLSNVGADVFCLQEVACTPTAPDGWLSYRDAGLDLPQRANLLDEVRAVLPDHEAFFLPVGRGPLHDDKISVPSEFGLVTFVRRGVSVIGHAADFIHGTFLADDWGPHPRARNAHCLRLFDHAGGFPVTVVQLHGLRDPAGKHDTPARDSQTEALIALIRRLWPKGERLVVCGDFNVLPESEMFAALGELGLTDLVTTRGYTDTRTSFYEKAGRFADYMLVNDAVVVRAFDVVVAPEVSDHRPLLIDIG